MKLDIVLTSAQQQAVRSLMNQLAVSPVTVLRGPAGTGKTSILKSLQATQGGVFLGVQQLTEARLAGGPAAIEEAFFRVLEDAIQSYDLVLVDDLMLITNAAVGGGEGRVHLLDAGLTAILAEARMLGRKLIFAVEEEIPWPLRRRAQVVQAAN